MINSGKKQQLMIGLAILVSLFWTSICGVAEEKHFSVSLKESQPFIINISEEKKVENLWLIVENKSAQTVRDLKVLTNNIVDTTDIDSLLKDILKGKKTEREKALAIWDFLTKYRYHFYPPTEGKEEHDPIRWLNVYGYGYCDDAATALKGLAEKAGLRARIWKLDGHIVSEVFFENRWNLLDAARGEYYLVGDGKTLASVEDIASHPQWLQRNESEPPDEMLMRIYTTKKDNTLWNRQPLFGYSIKWTLRPGEGFRQYSNNPIAFYSRKYPHRPPKFTNIVVTYQPDIKNSDFLNNVYQTANIQAIGGEGLTVDKDNQNNTGFLVLEFAYPYVCVKGAVELIVDLFTENKGFLEVYHSANARQWTPVFLEMTTPGVFYGDFSYLSYGRYKQYLMFKLRQLEHKALVIKAITARLILQCNPRTYPRLESGANKVKVSFQPQLQTAGLNLTYAWDESLTSPSIQVHK